jgi:hypothetical protein
MNHIDRQECDMLMNTRKAMLAAAVALTAGAVGFTGIAPSYAGAFSPPAQTEKSGWQNGVEQVKHRKYKKKKWSYRRDRDGRRYRYKRHGYVYYYDGYWYPRPYWREPGIYLRLDL